MKSKDCYHKAVAYLLTLDEECNKHVSDLFDFEKDAIKPFGTLSLPWQTGTSVKTTRLMFNLWSGVSIDIDKSESVYDETRKYYTPEEIFCCGYAPYFLRLAQAIMENPDYLVLDEPMSALDTEGIAIADSIIDEYHSLGRTILMTSHNVDDNERHCDYVLKVDKLSVHCV